MSEIQIDEEAVDSGDLLDLHYRMAILRSLEERVRELRLAEEVHGSVHLALGQEAIATGACAALAVHDTLAATYRGHGWAAAKGVPLERIIGELMGRSLGVNGGRGGSAYLSSAEHLFLGENSIVGAGAPIALGPALAARYDGSDRVSMAVFGDGAMNQGAVSEAFNFAAALSLPVIFVCENNGLSELTRIEDMVADPRLWRRAEAFGFPGSRVDGNDPVAVRSVVEQARARASAGDGPTLIEATTERIAGHYIGDHELYRRPGEIEDAMSREPLVRSRARLRSRGVSTESIESIEEQARRDVARATEVARADQLSPTSMAKEHVYVDH